MSVGRLCVEIRHLNSRLLSQHRVIPPPVRTQGGKQQRKRGKLGTLVNKVQGHIGLALTKDMG